jgi:hypothetical protein
VIGLGGEATVAGFCVCAGAAPDAAPTAAMAIRIWFTACLPEG